MKFIHLSDLHLGKRLLGYSLLEDQKYILERILDVIKAEKPDAVFIAGDVYDRSVPPEEAVTLFDDFLSALSDMENMKTFVISGNHDSPERLAFGSRLMQNSGVYISPTYNAEISPVSIEDEQGITDIFMLPFIKPVHIRRYFPSEEITDFTSAIKTAVDHMPIDPEHRNILLAHQFVTGAVQGGSEDINVGGLDNVEASVFAPFDYTALGHIHGTQNVSSKKIRYCGTPLKYSFSEAGQKKSVTVGTLSEKGKLEIKTIPLTPMREMHKLNGSFDELISRAENMNEAEKNAYLQITLTDDEDIYEAYSRLAMHFPYLMSLKYDNKRTRMLFDSTQSGADEMKTDDPVGLFGEFFEERNGYPLSAEQNSYINALCKKIWEGDES